ncbi:MULTISPECIES: putative quinol monooxygenase [Lactobacillus]|uniref:Antibiotic biosynthesis monooxygenase n=1 Tax=Lactobacillus xujianguonis TaxID=2495899 RepID=A0A437SW50_9LACO|nr:MULTISPECIES: antibiotic biosynthesis monooxygenase [Lactobacillus]RVU71165.1 antibiotic biosynthesis monooxygenase [Lactobacillus xujianguonis]RVU77512.1 antibiotic biosynthesis monooxygenase [Lactobacillus xujianguonis]
MKLTTAPIMRIFHLTINAKDHATFASEGHHNMMTSIENEAGTLLMFAGHDDDLGESNYVIECYQDADHYQVHANSPQFKHYGQVAKQIITGTEMTNLVPELVKSNDIIFRITKANQLAARLSKIKLMPEFDFKQLVNTQEQVLLAGRDEEDKNVAWVLELYPNTDAAQKYDLSKKVEVLSQIKLTVDIFVDQGSLSYESKAK